MAKVVVDGETYPLKKALKLFKEAAEVCEGSEQARMQFAYEALLGGYVNIDTYNEVAMYAEG